MSHQLILRQVNIAAPCGALDLSGIRPLATTAYSRRVRKAALNPGIASFTLAAATTNRTAACYQTETYTPGRADWPAGTWTVRLNIVVANFSLDWIETRIYAIDPACASIVEVGVATGNISLGSAGVVSMNVDGAAVSPGADAGYYIQIIVRNNHATMSQSASITQDQFIDAPIDEAHYRPLMGVGE